MTQLKVKKVEFQSQKLDFDTPRATETRLIALMDGFYVFCFRNINFELNFVIYNFTNNKYAKLNEFWII